MDEEQAFEADVRIGKGVRPIAQHGKVRIDQGTVTLEDSHGKIVAQAPVDQVWAKAMTFPLHGLRLDVGGTAYNLDAATTRWQAAMPGRLASGSAGKTSSFTHAFVAVLEDRGGHRGKR
jgi:hypothetical protein